MTGRPPREFFDAYAPDFDAIYGERHRGLMRLVDRVLRRSMRLRYERTIAGCRPVEGRSVLDVGCGPGHYAIALARLGAAPVVGIDFAPAMIERARAHARNQGVSESCRFEVEDFDRFTAAEPFDYVILMGFMDYAPNPEATVKHALALTRQQTFFSFPVARGPLAWQRRLRYRGKTALYLYDLERIRALFAEVPADRWTLTRLARDYFVTVRGAGS